MQSESPTEATVTTHPSIITNVTVVPDFWAEKTITETQFAHNYILHKTSIPHYLIYRKLLNISISYEHTLPASCKS